jgi:poly-beta-1,6-N-acetyl-D-glucosamine synthase
VRYILWLSLTGILYTYLGYPLAIWLLARLRPRPRIVASITPSVSVVLAVHNGISLLTHKLQHLIDLDYPNIKEIIVVSDGSTDGTAEMLACQQHPRLKAIPLPAHVGKAAALSAGIAQATSDILLFVDIRPEIAIGAAQRLMNNFADPLVGCVAGELTLRQDGLDAASAAVSSFYWRYEQWIRKSEALFDSPVGVYGGFYAIRRQLAAPLPAGLILDDMFQPLSIIRQGYRSVLDPQARVYDKWPEQVMHEFHRKVRTLAGNFQLFQLAPWTLTPRNRLLFQLVSHKVLRLIVPYLFILLVVSSALLAVRSPLYAAFATLQIAFWSVAIAGLGYRIPFLHRIAAPASALLVLNAAAVCALYKFLFTRGPLFEIWTETKPKAARTIPESEPLVPRKPPATVPVPHGASVPATISTINNGKTVSIDSHP